MGFLDIFRRPEQDVLNPKVLVCAVGDSFQEELVSDSEVYRRDLPNLTVLPFTTASELLHALAGKYAIVHILTDVSLDGQIGESQISGTELIASAANWGTKLVWIASGNDAKGYIKGFNPNRNKLNLVMTLDRRGERFSTFLSGLLTDMKSGASMPVAWNQLCPQIPGEEHPDAPSSIFYAGLGQVRFI